MSGMKEEDLAARVVAWLNDQHWDVYQEVQVRSYGRIADIVAVRKPVSWIIETKMNFGVAVLDQAVTWEGMANYVSIATPWSRRLGSPTLKRCMKYLGVGVIAIGSETVEERLAPSLRRRLFHNIADLVRDEHKSFALAGNANGSRWTPFQATCRDVLGAVRHKPGITMKELIDNVPTHYASSKTARSALSKWIGKGIVKGVKAQYEGRALRLYPEEAA